MNKIRKTLPAYLKALFNKNTPTSSKILALLAIAYIVLPADVLPDVLPFLGWLDDGLITILLIYFSNKMIPDLVKHEAMQKQIEN
ncbi:YkvA family protein [Anaerococcus kampingiae]|uniref:YkvA family protein n=1 Tax=Anaerococcus kampingae TaxID=3115614 RepID=A0ABW9MBC2_9FIRM